MTYWLQELTELLGTIWLLLILLVVGTIMAVVFAVWMIIMIPFAMGNMALEMIENSKKR
jgi:uncharacterized membrane protein